MNPRATLVISGILGVALGGVIVYWGAHATDNPIAPDPRIDTALVRPQGPDSVGQSEMTRLAVTALRLVRGDTIPSESASALHYLGLSTEAANNEALDVATSASQYVGNGLYAEATHADLYQRVNQLYDIRGLSGRSNRALEAAFTNLNKLAVHHMEQSIALDRPEDAVRTALTFDRWARRLTDDQRKRCEAVLVRIIEESVR
jgi:hypothetical protein